MDEFEYCLLYIFKSSSHNTVEKEIIRFVCLFFRVVTCPGRKKQKNFSYTVEINVYQFEAGLVQFLLILQCIFTSALQGALSV